MKKYNISSVSLKSSIIQLLITLNCIFLSGCITKYNATGIDETTDILVVEGVITDDESTITLTRSVNINEEGYWDPVSVANANVYVECEDGTQTLPALYNPPDYSTSERDTGVGKYIVKNGQLNVEHKYRLKIEVDNYEYVSDYSYPIKTPEIDSVFWRKRAEGEPVMIYISTRVPDDDILYFRWSYKEDWEINTKIDRETDMSPAVALPHRCWDKYSSRDIFLGSSENSVSDEIAEIITEISPWERRLSVLYRIVVKQNAISKRAYDYFVNIKKNSENIGSIFAPTPAELRGNIICITDPSKPAIGYIDVSSTTQKTQFISRRDNIYEEPSYFDCEIYTEDFVKLMEGIETIIPPWYEKHPPGIMPPTYVYKRCVDCRFPDSGRFPGTYTEPTTQKPDDWPTSY